jgi:hypothetical protein
MKASNTKKVITSVVALAIAFGVGVPLSNLLIAQSQPATESLAVEIAQVEDANSSDAVSALMAGDAVGRARGCSFGLRRPASAFVP